ncbi:AAA family ATPase [Brachybacterium huguangmaarense]|uniref:AAA family ATPase n=1 Tax=Brachybacterium huguangmaarense TaxID=1652028 RepID=A0ABY6G0Q8_9MICO|nr:AAA family ATPase [Brachybacterium huguangmaarense]UYG16258.1 AAA family ATPase [Brachybacterium huguangmaarense]
MRRARLVLLNGPPGAGKSTLARHLAEDAPLALALDVDQLKHALGRWDEELDRAGLHARELALALAAAQLASGRDVLVGQYVARPAFLDQLASVAAAADASWVEILLDVDEATLRARLDARARRPERPEQRVNARLVGPDDAPRLLESLTAVRAQRPGLHVVDARGDLEATAAAVRAVLDAVR